MILICLISDCLSNRAILICQYACFPAPKTVIVWTVSRFWNMIVDANAVRKAVNSSAFTTPVGLPVESSIVSVPRGVVLCELDSEAGGVNDVPLTVEAELTVDAGVSARPLRPAEAELIDDALELVGASGVVRDTIFIPTDVPVLAGINSVLNPFFFMIVRGG